MTGVALGAGITGTDSITIGTLGAGSKSDTCSVGRTAVTDGVGASRLPPENFGNALLFRNL